jgi:hypothetical protein
LPSSFEDVTSVILESDEVASHFRDYMNEFTNINGTSKFLEWPYIHPSIHPFQQHRMLFSSNNQWVRDGIQTIMTNVDQAEGEAVATITLHSRTATDTEILMTEFIACYLAVDMAWHYDSDHQELKKASKGTKGRQKRNVTEDNMLGIQITYARTAC